MYRHLLVLLLLIVVGCSDNRKNDALDLKSKQAVITVNGRVLTRGELLSRAEMMLKLRQLQDPSMKVSAQGKVKKELVRTYPKFFAEQMIWASYADDQKVQVDNKTLERIRSRAVRSVYRDKKMKYGAFRAKFGSLAPVLDEHVRMMAVTFAAKKRVCELNPTNIPPNYASNIVQQIKVYNSSIAQTNAMIYARATNCWQKLTAGADFVDMVSEYSDLEQERNDNGEWGTLDLQQLEPDEALHSFVKTHAPGDISPPLEGDNGLMILRIDGRKDVECKLSRIYFQLPMFVQERTVEQVLKHERDLHDNKTIAAKYRELKKAATIVKGEAKPGVKAKAAKKKAVQAKNQVKLSPEEEKRLEERQKAEAALKEEIKQEVFSGSNQKPEAKDSSVKK